MQNPYEQPSGRAGRSLQREEPESQWEQQRSSSGSSEPPEQEEDVPVDEQPEQEATPTNVQDDPMGEEVVDLWEAEDPPNDDFIVEQATRSSISASNPWILYEAGIVCSHGEDGQLEKNSSGEKVVVLREWGRLLGPQRVALRRQSIGRADWEKLPWTGHLCYLFTRSWEIGRLRSYYKKTGSINLLRELLDECRYYHTDWMRGAGEPLGWDERFDIDRDQWHEQLLLYERDLMIQEDMEWLAEAVYVFYRKHLDKLIRENDRMWEDFCQKKYDDDGNEVGLELNTFGYDMTSPNIEVPMNKKTIIPDLQRHFSFSTKMMVLAVELYQQEAPRDFCHHTTFAYRKLKQFVDERKEITAQSYRFFVEHAYNQFFQHEAFHQTARARTKAKDLNAGDFHTSTKLDGYAWVASAEKIAHVPKDQADDVDMEDDDEDDETQFLPSLQVIVRPQEQTKVEEGVGSLQKEETPQPAASSDDDEVVFTDLARINRPEDRYGFSLSGSSKVNINCC